ncbi:MAG: ABC transporter ATP-binding protein [Rhodospirillaceae bacterium]|nr:ABC transporter ATP-binding protein [Rhodospirillaceae bacterium]MCY4239694.1 ABC transporter ATP-binding protein [Rhodospirillaceae bacterium]
MLNAKGMIGGYGGADILKGVDLDVNDGEIVAIIGPNGAGKSTALKAVFGLVQLQKGHVYFKGEEITNGRADALVRQGMAYVPQERNVFPSLSVHENLEMGAFIRRDDFSDAIEMVYTLFPPLKDKRRQPAGELSGGQRQMVAFGRALMTEPSLLLLDEPTAGLSPVYMQEILERVIAVNETGVGILMVEQNARQALKIAHRGYVLATGETIFCDTGKALLANPEVAVSFLGGHGSNSRSAAQDAAA